MKTQEEFFEFIENARSIRKVLEKHSEVDLETYPTTLTYKVNNRKNLFKAITDYVCYGLLPENKTLYNLWQTYHNSSKRKKWINPDFKVAFECDGLIEKCLTDIALHGADFKVYAIYDIFFGCNKFIMDYVDADCPDKEEAEFEENYKELIKEYEQGIESIKTCFVEKITLQELLDKLTYQGIDFK